MSCSSLSIIQGTTLQSSVTIKNSDGTPVNLTGASVSFTLSSPSGDVKYTGPIAITTPLSGICQINISAGITDTWTPGNYLYEIQYTGSSGDIHAIEPQKAIVTAKITP